MRLNGLELSWDQWLLPTPTTGKSAAVQLHDDLYEVSALAANLRRDVPFVPHVSLGHLARKDDKQGPANTPLNVGQYTKARAKIDTLQLDYSYAFTQIELISVSADSMSTKTVASFNLGSR